MKRPWCCPDPRCIPVHQLVGGEPDLSIPTPGDSFFCFGRMGEPVTFIYDGSAHTNDLHSCAYTPPKGLIVWQENADDWRALANAYRRAERALDTSESAT